MNQKILNKITELNRANKELFDRKAELKKEILSIDIGIYETMKEYDKLYKKLYKELK